MMRRSRGKTVSLVQIICSESQCSSSAADGIASLRAQAAAFKSVRLALRDSTPPEEAARKAFDKVFFHDVKTLLSMADMWKSRKPPLPLNYDEITQAAASSAKENGSSPSVNLRDQKQLSLAECLELFIARYELFLYRLLLLTT